MPEIDIPLTTYRVSASKPNQKFGSPAALPIQSAAHRVYAQVPLDKIPTDAVMTVAELRVYANRVRSGGGNVRVVAPTAKWNSSVTWNKQPAVSSVLATTTPGSIVAGQLFTLDVLGWAVGRSRDGLRIESTSGSPAVWINGSSAATNKPVLHIEYTVPPDAPSNMVPDGVGAAVSVDQPVLNYIGDEGMTSQLIEFSDTGSASDIDYDTGWVAATEGRYDPADDPGSPPVLSDGGAGIYWRATTDGEGGQSVPSAWAYYEYVSIESPVITNPPATTDDGSPTLQWTITDQTSFRVLYYSESVLLEDSGWINEAATRDWTPSKGIKVPGGLGRFVLRTRDSVIPRAAAENAVTYGEDIVDFTTVISGAGTAVDTLVMTYTDPIPVLTGTRALGIPDFIGLFRDGVQVPLWSPIDGTVYTSWAPGADFFSGTAFTLRDYTCDLRHQHTWEVRVKASGVTSAGLSVTDKFFTRSVWLVDPRTGDQVEVLGYNEVPVVDQTTTEGSIVHTPVHGELIVEPKRRRLMRTTRMGTVSGVVLNEDEETLDDWVKDDSDLRYRLIFGKVNWPVILGDYSPVDTFYPDDCDDDHLLISVNWWQRIQDI